jgi:hypothetical protein
VHEDGPVIGSVANVPQIGDATRPLNGRGSIVVGVGHVVIQVEKRPTTVPCEDLHSKPTRIRLRFQSAVESFARPNLAREGHLLSASNGVASILPSRSQDAQ